MYTYMRHIQTLSCDITRCCYTLTGEAAYVGALMGLSSLAVMGNSLTLQLHGRPSRHSPRADMLNVPSQHSHMQTAAQHHHEAQAQTCDAADRVNG